MRAIRLAALVACIAATPGSAAECPVARVDLGRLSHAADALAKSGEFTVVAFGSSSTQGWMSSDAAHSYPAILQSALSAALPGAHVAVLNRGIGGQDAAEELPRLDTDVTPLKPSLVIWQVGANGALRHTDPDIFRRLVLNGIDRLRKAGIDVVLMDNQRAPLILASQSHARIDTVLGEVARQENVALFSRGSLMDAWRADGHGYEQFVSPDGLHHNDLGYRCIALALAQGIADGVSPVRPPMMTSSALPPTPPRAPAR